MVKIQERKHNIESPSLLYREYDWYEKLFPLALQKSTDGFFLPGVCCELVGISKNINLLQTKEPYFVTKVRIDKFYDMYLRISSKGISMLLNKGLGRSGRPFNIDTLTELEKNVLTGFNEYVSKIVVPFLEPPPVVNFVRTNFDMTHLTFIIRDEETGAHGRFILSVPDGRIAPKKIETTEEKFENTDFYECNTSARLVVGKTRFTVKELKNIEKGDLVVLEDSDIHSLSLYVLDEVMKVLIVPDMSIELPFSKNNGGSEMSGESAPKNLWDSIEVEMYAELNPVKITLGNLKKIELGQVVDVAALYENKITLRVENKVIGHGELVIVNDRYGVKITDIIQKKSGQISAPNETSETNNESTPEENNAEEIEQPNENENQEYAEDNLDEESSDNTQGEDEEFDYSDFELEDEDI